MTGAAAPALPRVSVVVPAYQAAATIVETLRSALAQEGVDLELLVVDDGSTDGTAELARSLGPAVQVLRQANAGVGAARNRGVAAATGDYVAFLDGDDLWRADKLSRQVAALAARPQAGVCYTGVRLIDERGADIDPPLAWAQPGPRPEGDIFRHLLLEGNPVCTSSVLVRRDLLLRVGPFGLRRDESEDLDLWLRLARVSQFAYLPELLTEYRVLPASYYRADPRRARQRTLNTLQRAEERWGLDRPGDRAALARRRAGTQFAAAYELLRQERQREALPWLLQALRTAPLATPAALHLATLALPRPLRRALGRLRRRGAPQPR